tara:strand:- start:209 stop:1642 length:1434 start_codon:yes stop_codon:yes gene_type:complete
MRITLFIVAGFLLIAGGGFFVLMKTISEDVERQYSQASEEPLVDFAHLFAGILEQDIEAGEIDSSAFRAGFKSAYERKFLARIYQLEKQEIQTHVYITNEIGIVIYDSDEGEREGQDYSRFNDVFLARQGKYGVRASRSDPDDSKTTVFYIAVPVNHNGDMIGTLTVSRPETAMAPFAEQSRQLVVRASLITAAVVFLLGTVWAYLVLYPIRDLTRHALHIARGEKDSVPATGVAELRTLSLALEDMRRELEGKHYVENYVQALTHELKSPLAAIRGAAELIDESMPMAKQRRFLDNILVETTRSEDMVRRLVQLASVESQSRLEKWETIDLSALVSDELGALASVMETQQIQLTKKGFKGAFSIEGDALMLRIAVRNVLTNACDFSPELGEITVSLKDDNGAILLIVSDEGPGIPAYAVSRVFDRFYSLKNEVTGRKGSGIGLSFVKATMSLHHGSSELSNRSERGTEMRLRFGRA